MEHLIQFEKEVQEVNKPSLSLEDYGLVYLLNDMKTYSWIEGINEENIKKIYAEKGKDYWITKETLS